VKSDDQDGPIAGKLNSAKKYVASMTLKKLDWNNSTLVKGDIVQEIENLKQQNGPELQVHGSGNLIQTLLKHDLIDEFRLKIFPITLGTGKRLFSDGTIPAGFKLVDSKTSTTGVIVATYELAGNVKTGSFALETPTEAELARRNRLNEGK
jgi:dihydrofolate reductase